MKLIDQYKGLRREIYVLFICELVDNAGSLVGPMLTLILSMKMGLDAGQIAVYFLIYSLFSLPINLLGGRLTDKFNKKYFINVCDITTSVIYIVCGFVGLNYITLSAYMLGSLIQKAESPAYKSLIADYTTSKDRDRAYSLSYFGLNLGLVAAPTLGGILIEDHLGLMFILSGAFQLFSLAIFDIFVKGTDTVGNSDNKYERTVENTGIFEVLKKNRVMIPYLAVLALSMLLYNIYGYLVPLGIENAHGENGSFLFGTVSSVNCITVLVFTAVLTAVFSKCTTFTRMISGNLFEMAGLFLFFVSFGTPFIYYIAIVVFTFGEILNTTTTTSHLTKRIPMNYRGRVLAFSSVVSNLTISLGRYGVGKLYDNISPDAAWTAVFILGAVTVIGYLLLAKEDKKEFAELYK